MNVVMEDFGCLGGLRLSRVRHEVLGHASAYSDESMGKLL